VIRENMHVAAKGLFCARKFCHFLTTGKNYLQINDKVSFFYWNTVMGEYGMAGNWESAENTCKYNVRQKYCKAS